MPGKGLHHSDETKAKISATKMGHIVTAVAKDKMRIAKLKNPTRYWLGKKRPNMSGENHHMKHPDIKAKIGKAMKGRSCPWMIGKNNTNWNGGSSFWPYCRLFNKEFKEETRMKWGNVCFICGASPNGKSLDVHHIHYDKQAGCNGRGLECVPLCQSHNAKANSNREWWIVYFENRLWNIFGWHMDLIPEES